MAVGPLGHPGGARQCRGDLSVWGALAPGESWLVGTADPWKGDEDAGMLAVSGRGAVATSSVLGRRWTTDRGERHHLIDPRTMESSRSDIVQCTVAGPRLPLAEAWAKALCILGSDEGLKLFRERAPSYSAFCFTEEGRLIYCGRPEKRDAWTGREIDRTIGE
ncbi:FAD:protein FMN transferase [Paenibacillus sp. CC-CFT747]|nr:FAD:protein FMN transferase [Paenibacillus sp. CC-CFT747]